MGHDRLPDATDNGAHLTEMPPADTDPPVKVPLKVEDWISVLVLAALSLITMGNVVVRYLSDQSFAWTEEISIFLMMVLALVAGSAAAARDRQIRIEFFMDRGSKARQRFLALFSAGFIVLMFLALTVLGAQLAWDEFRFDETSPGIGVPKWIYTIWLPILSLAIAGRALGVFIRRWRSGK